MEWFIGATVGVIVIGVVVYFRFIKSAKHTPKPHVQEYNPRVKPVAKP